MISVMISLLIMLLEKVRKRSFMDGKQERVD